jgi:hypothetical protein
MAVEDHLRLLSEMRGNIYLGSYLGNTVMGPVSWYEGRLQQANDGSWIFRSSSSDGTIVAFQLGRLTDHEWHSAESPQEGITVSFLVKATIPIPGQANPQIVNFGIVALRSQLPQQVTN